MEALHLTWSDFVLRVNFPMLVASVVLLCAAWLGVRTVFSLPLDLRANWLFRVTPAPGGAACLAAVRRALLAAAVIPVLAATAVLLIWHWPLVALAEHLLILALLGILLTELSLRGFRKIPFTCSWLPGKSKVHLVFWFGIIPLVMAIHKAAQLEQHAMANPLSYWTAVGILGAAALAARLFTDTESNRSEPEIQFEEVASDELIGLGLNR